MLKCGRISSVDRKSRGKRFFLKSRIVHILLRFYVHESERFIDT